MPEWIEPLAVHLVKRHYSDPHWDKDARHGDGLRARDAARAHDRAEAARALRADQPAGSARDLHPPRARRRRARDARRILRAQPQARRELRELEHKARRRDVLVDEHTIYEFYDAIVPAGIYNAAGFERWRREAEEAEPEAPFPHARVPHAARRSGDQRSAFPDALHAAGPIQAALPLRPGHPLDGVTVTVPLQLLNTLDEAPFDWLVPGLLREKVTWCIKALPKNIADSSSRCRSR